MDNTKKIVSILDFTRLQQPDDKREVISFFHQSKTPWGPTAGVCVYPEWVETISKHNIDNTQLVTVANFPKGNKTTQEIFDELNDTLADEIDVVIPYHALKLGHKRHVMKQLEAIRLQFPKKILKGIIEVAMLSKDEIRKASELVCQAEFQFIKTSTGTVPYQITEEDIQQIVSVVQNNSKPMGIKLSGGIATKAQALFYMNQIQYHMGDEFLNPTTFRIGASGLLTDLKSDN